MGAHALDGLQVDRGPAVGNWGRLFDEDVGEANHFAGWLPDGYNTYMAGVPSAFPEDGLLCTLALARPDGTRRLLVLTYDVYENGRLVTRGSATLTRQ